MELEGEAASAVVKSARRVFEVLELFRRTRQRMTAGEIGQSLGYPKSSTLVLLKSLVSLGYLVFDSSSMCYLPSLTVTQLGEWIPALVLGSRRGLQTLEEINAETQETVTLSVQADLSCRILRVVSGNTPISLHVDEGLVIPLLSTAVGEAITAQLSEAEIADLCERHNSHAKQTRKRTDLESVMKRVREVRQRGYSLEYESVWPDTGAIAVPFPSEIDGYPMALCVVGMRERIRRNEAKIYKTIRSSLTRLLGSGGGARAATKTRRST